MSFKPTSIPVGDTCLHGNYIISTIFEFALEKKAKEALKEAKQTKNHEYIIENCLFLTCIVSRLISALGRIKLSNTDSLSRGCERTNKPGL